MRKDISVTCAIIAVSFISGLILGVVLTYSPCVCAGFTPEATTTYTVVERQAGCFQHCETREHLYCNQMVGGECTLVDMGEIK